MVPAVLPLAGGLVQLAGRGFQDVTTVMMGGRRVDFEVNTLGLVVAAPFANATGYALVVMDTAPNPNTTNVTTPFFTQVLVFYSPDECLGVGQWKTNPAGSGCLPCPKGGYCPGGGRVWPLQGWWSFTEWRAPGACLAAEACPGVDRQVQVHPLLTEGNSTSASAATSAVAGVDTTMCSDGYVGPFCQKCQDGWYRAAGELCRSCGANAEEERNLILHAIMLTIFFALFLLSVCFLSGASLTKVMGRTLLVQQMVLISVKGAVAIGVSAYWLLDVLVYINIINFDIAVIKPGCAVPLVPFLQEAAYIYMGSVLTAILCVLLPNCPAPADWPCRGAKRSLTDVQPAPIRKNLTVHEQSFWGRHHRSVLALLILGFLFHNKLTLLALKGLTCRQHAVRQR